MAEQVLFHTQKYAFLWECSNFAMLFYVKPRFKCVLSLNMRGIRAKSSGKYSFLNIYKNGGLRL